MEEHICKYCGVLTKEPDENCYKYILNNAESGTIKASQLERMVMPEIADGFCDQCKTLTLNPTKASLHYCGCCGRNLP